MKRISLHIAIVAISFLLILMIPAIGALEQEDIIWTQAMKTAPFSPRSYHSTIVFNDRMWIIGGIQRDGSLKNDVWYTFDGVEWDLATASADFSPRYGHATIVFDNKMWIIGGYDGSFKNDVWYSTDGITWNQVRSSNKFIPRCYHTTVVFDNKIWVIGGEISEHPAKYVNDVWYSTDGFSWNIATASAEFTPRVSHTSVVMNDRIWVIGGCGDESSDIKYCDIWNSKDGATWSQKTSANSLLSRYHQTSIVFDGKIWILGGSGCKGGSLKNDIWNSIDGIQWNEIMNSAGFSPRLGHTTAVFNNKIWVIGGYDGTYNNDIWVSLGKQETEPKIIFKKLISPQSIKQGQDVTVILSLFNRGPTAVWDLEIVDPTPPGFRSDIGNASYSIQILGSKETQNYSYTIHSLTAGSFNTGQASLLYSDQSGNYHLIKSNNPSINVFAPIISSSTSAQPTAIFNIESITALLGLVILILIVIIIYQIKSGKIVQREK